MSELTDTFQAIATAIKTKSGDSSSMSPSEMPERIMSINGDSQPVGTILPYGGTNAPTGYLLCDGSEYNREDYPRLFEAIGTSFGAGDGSTTFNVPDMREVTPVGAGTSTRTETTHDAFALGEFKDDQNQSHTHTVTVTGGNHSHSLPRGLYVSGGSSAAVAGASGFDDAGPCNYSGNLSMSGTTAANSGRAGDVTRGKRLGVNYIIKARMAQPDPSKTAILPVGSIIHSATCDNLDKVLEAYGGTMWIQHSGYVLRGATTGVTANQAQKDGGSDDAVVVEHSHSVAAVNTGTDSNNHVHYENSESWVNQGGSGNHYFSDGSTYYHNTQSVGGRGNTGTSGVTAWHYHTVPAHTTAAEGVDGTDANIPNYKSVYIWERTA